MRIMALDIGTKRIGVALTDELQIISQPYTTIEYKDRKRAFEEIKTLVDVKEVGTVIAGLPLNLSGDPTPMTKTIEQFIKELEKILDKEIIRVDERYSSQEAEQHMRMLGKKPSKNKADIDKIAAAILLKAYMDENR